MTFPGLLHRERQSGAFAGAAFRISSRQRRHARPRDSRRRISK